MKTLADWKLHSWYRTRDGRKAWLAAIATGPDGEPAIDYPLIFCLGIEICLIELNGKYLPSGTEHKNDIIGPWTDEPRPLGRYDPVKHTPTEADGEWLLVQSGVGGPYTMRSCHVLKDLPVYKWWCPLKPILEMEVQK